MMDIVIISTGPEWKEFVQAPREIITAVRIDSLEETKGNPSIHREDMEILGNGTVHDWYSNCAQAEH